jgi:Mn-dependent DtxR family transcriptional regulator
MNFWLIPLLLFVPVPPSAHSPDAVLERLAKTGVFALGPVGFARITSPGETDYKTVLNRSSALEDFEKLLSTGNSQAKCYALVAIHSLDPTRFADLAQPLRDSKETVTTMSGCVMSGETVGNVIKQIESGRFS